MILQNNDVPNFFTEMVKQIHSGDSGEIQDMALVSFCNIYRDTDIELLRKYKSFIIFNDTYLLDITGGMADLEMYGLYYRETCKFKGRLVIPITGFDGRVYGFVGYDNGNEKEKLKESEVFVKYLYTGEVAFKKERHMLMSRDEFEKAVDCGYVCIVDGIFDKITLTSLGIPAVSILGSHLSKYHKYYLKYIKKWVVVSDNDSAGKKLFEYCKSVHTDTVQLKFVGAKDIDELMRKTEKEVLWQAIGEMKITGFRLNIDMDKKWNRVFELQDVEKV